MSSRRGLFAAAVGGAAVLLVAVLIVAVRTGSPSQRPVAPSSSPTVGPTTAPPSGTRPQTLRFPTPATVRIGQAAALRAASDSGLPVLYRARPRRVCTIVLNAPEAQAHGAGICVVTATQPGDHTYAAATPLVRRFRVERIPQALRLDGPRTLAVGGRALVVATASSELPVTVTVRGTTPQGRPVCTVEDQVVTALATGTCRVRGTQAGDYQFSPARPRTLLIEVVR